MRKLIIMAALVALFVMACFATAAYAATINGTDKADHLFGTNHADVMKGFKNSDYLVGRGGADKLYGGPGEDFLRGYGGNDELWGGPDETSPKTTDHFRCGSGYDVVHVVGPEHAPHNVAPNCEKVVTEK